MSDAQRDNNFIPAMIAISSDDGETIVPVEVNPSGHYLEVDDDTTGSDLGGLPAARDNNFVPVLMAVSADDGVTPVELYVNSDGKLLIDSN